MDNICITSGAVQGLKLIADGLLVPQSKIIIETPSYINSIRTWHNIKSKMIPLSINYIKRNINNIFKISSNYKNSIFYCIPTLHNPTQNTYTKEKSKNYRSMSKTEYLLLKIVYILIYGLMKKTDAHEIFEK